MSYQRRSLPKSEPSFDPARDLVNADAELVRPLPTALDNGQSSPRKLLELRPDVARAIISSGLATSVCVRAVGAIRREGVP